VWAFFESRSGPILASTEERRERGEEEEEEEEVSDRSTFTMIGIGVHNHRIRCSS
jgi:hypothetical protein